MKCCKCGRDIPPDSKFCQYCGEDLSKFKYCPSCGAQLQDGMNFCPECGGRVRDAATEQPATLKDSVSTLEEAVLPAGEDSAVVVPSAVPTELSEEQVPSVVFQEEQPDYHPPDTPQSTLEETVNNLEQSISGPGEEPQTEEGVLEEAHPPATGSPIKKTTEVSGVPVGRKRDKWLWKVILCVIVVMVAGIYLWIHYDRTNRQPNPDVDISEIANSVLYLEVLDENDELIGTASGFLVNDQTTLVTNYHVAQDASHIVATTADGTQSTDVSCILAYDEIADLAILNCDSKAMAEPLAIGDSEVVRQGDAVYVIGYPLGVANTLSNGIVGSRYIDEYENDIIQVTAAISQGNSGGPVLNADGQVIGVMCAYYIYGQNLNIAIASNTLEALLESRFEKTALKDWVNRPEMPDAEAEIEEVPDPEARESGDPSGNASAGSGTEPETPAVIDEERPQNGKPNREEPNRSGPTPAQRPEEILQGAWAQEPLDSMPFNKYDYFEFSDDRVYNESYYCSPDAEFILVYTGTFTIDGNGSLCFHMAREETYFADGRQEINNAFDTDWSPRPITALSEDSYTTSGALTYHRTSGRPTKLSEWEANRQNEEASAFSALSEWIVNNSNSTMSGDEAYQETVTGEDCVMTYRVIYSAGLDQICLMNVVGYYSGATFTTFLWLTPNGNTFNSTFYQSDTVNSVCIFEGSGTIYAPSFNKNSTFVFSSYEGDSSMMDTRQSVAASMVRDSLNFMDYLLILYVSPSGHYFSSSDFGFNI